MLEEKFYKRITKIGRKVTGITKLIKNDHTRKDDFALVTNPSSAHVTDGHETAIQYLQ